MKRRTILRDMVAATAATFVPLRTHGVCALADGPASHRVEIKDLMFFPSTLSVQVGDTVTWVNQDVVPHTATALDISWDSGEIAANESTETVVKEGMIGAYFCRFHPVMTGELLFTSSGRRIIRTTTPTPIQSPSSKETSRTSARKTRIRSSAAMPSTPMTFEIASAARAAQSPGSLLLGPLRGARPWRLKISRLLFCVGTRRSSGRAANATQVNSQNMFTYPIITAC